MVARKSDASQDQNSAEAYYDELQERWPQERPSRRRPKRAYRRREVRRIVVRTERLDPPDAARVSKALLVAQRELARIQAEKDARDQETHHG